MLIIVFIVIGGSLLFVFRFRYRAISDYLSFGFVGRCIRCGCFYEIPGYQVSIIRQGGSVICLICNDCRQPRTCPLAKQRP